MTETRKNTGIMSEEEVKGILRNIGEMIKTARNNKGWSMAQLAEKSGISSSLISDLENNKGKVPNICTLISIARALNLADDEFIKGFWNQSKTVRKRNKQSVQETVVSNALLEYGIPQKALGGVMDYINMLVRVGKMYNTKYRADEVLNNPDCARKIFTLAQHELLNYYAKFV